MSSNGLCIIPEGRVIKSSLPEGYPWQVTNIILLDEILDYSRKNNLSVLYMTSSNGLSYADDVVKAPDMPLYKHTREWHIRYNVIIAEEMSRKCIQFQTSRLIFMRRYVYDSLDISCDILKAKGVEVIQPILGCDTTKARIILERSFL
jgi:hypothetical protein